MNLLVKGRPSGMEIANVTPQSAHWKYVGFAAYRLQPQEGIRISTRTAEVCIVVLSGTVTIQTDELTWRKSASATAFRGALTLRRVLAAW